MAKYRIVAHAMNAAEIAAARQILPNGNDTPAFVSGIADDGQIQALKEKGLLVERLIEVDDAGRPKERPRFETVGTGASARPGFAPRMTTFSNGPKIAADQFGAVPVDLAAENVYLVEIAGPLLSDYTKRLNDLGVELIEAYGESTYSAMLSGALATTVRALDFVVRLTLYDARQTAAGARAPALGPLGVPAAAAAPRVMRTYDVKTHQPPGVPTVLTWLKEHNVAIAGSDANKIRIYLIEGDPLFAALCNLPEVQRCEEFVRPSIRNDRARILIGLDTTPPSVPHGFGDGTGETIGIADTGIDPTHPDFAGRVVAVPLGRPVATDDPNGHGTHVAGSIAGDGHGSGGAIKGTAPGARIYFQSLLDAMGELGGLPLSLDTLLRPAYAAGVRIHSNSWGSATRSTYTLGSEEIDGFVDANKDMLVVISAGNEGQAAVRVQPLPIGVVDWLSLGSPATAKNAITVGASRSDRTTDGLAGNWKAFSPNAFPDPWIGSQLLSGDAACMAGFSSRGPSDDHRIKPDIVAPGTNILSARSSTAPAGNYWALYPANVLYAFDGGTSMATPLVSGCAALIRRYYIETRLHPRPSAALLRATIVAGARWLGGADANASNGPVARPAANFDQGFGCIDMAGTLPNPNAPGLALAFVDTMDAPAEQMVGTGDFRRYVFDVVAGTSRLSICLAYTDASSRGLQNNLNLFVQEPGGTKRMGNEGIFGAFAGPDRDNNVEVIRYDNPAPGPYAVQITASNLLRTPQDFALVVTGPVTAAGVQPL